MTTTYHVLFIHRDHYACVPGAPTHLSESGAESCASAIKNAPDHIVNYCFVGRRTDCPQGAVWHTRDESGTEWELLDEPPFAWPVVDPTNVLDLPPEPPPPPPSQVPPGRDAIALQFACAITTKRKSYGLAQHEKIFDLAYAWADRFMEKADSITSIPWEE